MRKANTGITPEGAPSIALTAFAALLCAILQCWPGALCFFILFCFCLNFFRDPERVIPQEADLAVSPADGRIIRIEQRPDPFSGEQKLCVSVFMNVFSVHVNRSPVAGHVQAIRYWPGKFFNASLDKASTDNERCAWSVCAEDGGLWSMVQIAGLVARRIVPRAEAGDRLARGERFGMIRFGSRVDLYLASGYRAAVEIGEQVFAGQSVIARKADPAQEPADER